MARAGCGVGQDQEEREEDQEDQGLLEHQALAGSSHTGAGSVLASQLCLDASVPSLFSRLCLKYNSTLINSPSVEEANPEKKNRCGHWPVHILTFMFNLQV